MQSFLIFTTQSFIVFLLGVGAQKLVMEESHRLTPCSEHLRSDIDLYVVTVRLGDNLKHLMSTGWQHLVTIQMSTNTSSIFQDVCQILVNTTECASHLQSKCYCFQRNSTVRGATFVVTVPARAVYSHGSVQAVWRNGNGTSVHSDQLSLPAIFDDAAAVLNLTVTVNNISESTQVTETCSTFLTSGVHNILMLCCYNTAQPCYPFIQLGGFIVTNNNTPCSSYIFNPEPGYTSKVAISYSVCSQRERIEISNCTLEAGHKFHKYFKYIPKGLYVFSAGLGFCWLVVAILYVVVKIFRPRQEQRRDEAMNILKADENKISNQETTATPSETIKESRSSSMKPVGDQVTERNKDSVSSEVPIMIVWISALTTIGFCFRQLLSSMKTVEKMQFSAGSTGIHSLPG